MPVDVLKIGGPVKTGRYGGFLDEPRPAAAAHFLQLARGSVQEMLEADPNRVPCLRCFGSLWVLCRDALLLLVVIDWYRFLIVEVKELLMYLSPAKRIGLPDVEVAYDMPHLGLVIICRNNKS